MGKRPQDFDYRAMEDGSVRITHRGAPATTLRGHRASDFLDDVEGADDRQLLMARVTGNYRRGNERVAKQHPRNG